MPSTPTPEKPWKPVIDGPRLRQLRTKAQLSQRELIEKCAALGTKIDRGNLHRAERGLPGAIGIKKARVVAQVLGVDMADFLTPHGRELIGIPA
ncbi:MAG: helix-turn-helix domain-containing protein [Trebonia sp.]